jgi:hypothetical protein
LLRSHCCPIVQVRWGRNYLYSGYITGWLKAPEDVLLVYQTYVQAHVKQKLL